MRYEIKNIPKHRDNFVHSPLLIYWQKEAGKAQGNLSIFSIIGIDEF